MNRLRILSLTAALACSHPLLTQTQTTSDPGSTSDRVANQPKPCAPDANGLYKATDIGMKMPEVIWTEAPYIPGWVQHKSIKTAAVVRLTVNAKGRPENPSVLQSTARRMQPDERDVAQALDKSALEAVKHYRFRPARCGNTPVPVPVNVDIAFQID